mgnify:CR=1 FL=1
MIRVGFGYDVHRLVEGRDLWLGGVKIAHDRGLDGHSDADVLIHAICDAMLGAANMRDIGYHFPDTSEATKDIDSKIILRDTVALLAEKGYHLGNIDATVCAERPKLSPHIDANVKPELVHNCCKAFFDGDTAKARELQLEMLPLADALFCEVNPIPVKYAMNVLGWEAGECRLPLVEPSEAHKEYIEKALRAEGLIKE